jgi:large subunit ribosomal protein L13
MSVAEFEADVVVDARDCILGRVASNVAGMAMDGQRVAVVNVERAVKTGGREDVIGVFRERRRVGSDRGPYYPKRPDGIFKRSIRGMIPHKTTKGREAFENVRCYVGNPYDDAGEVLEGTSLDRLSNIKFVSLGEISEQLGANRTW